MISMMKLAKKFQNPFWKFLDQFQFPMKVCASPCLQKVQRGRIVLLLDRDRYTYTTLEKKSFQVSTENKETPEEKSLG